MFRSWIVAYIKSFDKHAISQSVAAADHRLVAMPNGGRLLFASARLSLTLFLFVS